MYTVAHWYSQSIGISFFLLFVEDDKEVLMKAKRTMEGTHSSSKTKGSNSKKNQDAQKTLQATNKKQVGKENKMK